MFTRTKMFALATAAAVSMPVWANAAVVQFDNDLVANESYSFSHVIAPGDTVDFRFTVLEDLRIPEFSLSGTGNNGEADVEDVQFGFVEPVTNKFTTISSVGGAAAGFGFLDGMTFDSGSMFSVIFDDGITDAVAVTVSFGTESISPIPLPATGLLLAPFLLAGGIIGLRRRKTAPPAAG